MQKIKMGRSCSQNERKECIKILTAKPTRNRSLQSLKRRFSANIREGLKAIDDNKRDKIDWTQDREYWGTLVNAALSLRVS